ncbi:MAG: non-heme iron oxygenase ferredoxin subunit [Burkholderiaceae bacterium]
MSDGAQWIKVAEASQIRANRTRLCRVGDKAICLYNVGGTIYASDDLCTHGMASLADGYIDGDEIVCPLHDGRFCIASGKATGAPCTVDLRTYSVTVTDGAVMLDSAELARTST